MVGMKTWQVLATAHGAQTSWMVQATGRTAHSHPEELEQLAMENSFRAQGREDRRQGVRYRVAERAVITLCHPVEAEAVPGHVVDVSAQGLRVRLPRCIYRGSQVQVQVEKAVVFGSIRYCRAIDGDNCDVGIAIDQIVMLAGRHLAKNTAEERGNGRHDGGTVSYPIEVLLVEDNPADIKLMQVMFAQLDVKCRLAVAADGMQALGRLLDPTIPKPDLVLLDLSLPRLSGLEVLRELRKERLTELVAVAILSGSAAAADVKRTSALGIRAYLVKPNSIIDCAELRKNLGTLISDTVH
jgi:CheY-like chemotaxis protein